LDENKHYIINEREAEAVRIIFNMNLKGHGYGDIINTLNARGYKTKLGRKFGKNSIYEILRNEKYTGTYVYNKTASQSKKGTFNRHIFKDEKEIIKIEGVVYRL